MIKNYSAKNHRGNELITNLGQSTNKDSVVIENELSGRFSYFEATLTDGSGASLSFTIDIDLSVQIGFLFLTQFRITYPSTASTANAKIANLPYLANGKYSVVIYEGINTVHSYDGIIDNDGVLQIFLNGVAVQNVALSTKTLLIKLGYVEQ